MYQVVIILGVLALIGFISSYIWGDQVYWFARINRYDPIKQTGECILKRHGQEEIFVPFVNPKNFVLKFNDRVRVRGTIYFVTITSKCK